MFFISFYSRFCYVLLWKIIFSKNGHRKIYGHTSLLIKRQSLFLYLLNLGKVFSTAKKENAEKAMLPPCYEEAQATEKLTAQILPDRQHQPPHVWMS